MPFFGSKKNEKKEKPAEKASYPRQQVAPPPPQLAHHSFPQGAFVAQTDQFYYNPTGAPNYTVAIQRNDLPGQAENFCEGFLDGPDFSNPVLDQRIPPAPGSFYFVTHGNVPGPSSSVSHVPPPSSTGARSTCPPPPSYEEVLSQEVKKKL